MQTLFWSLLNISVKYHQNRSIWFRAIPFQSWALFYETRCISSCLLTLSAATEPYCLYRLNIVGYVLLVRQNSASNANNVKIYMTFSVKKLRLHCNNYLHIKCICKRLSPERRSARMSKITKWRLNSVRHRMLYSLGCYMPTVGVKGLNESNQNGNWERSSTTTVYRNGETVQLQS